MRARRTRQSEADLTPTFRKMTKADAPAATALLRAFLAEDEFYLDSGAAYGDMTGGQGVAAAVELFLTRPELGFIWLALRDGKAAGCCIICYAISTSIGGLVGKLDDVFVADGARGQGIGSAMLDALAAALKQEGVGRIDTAVHHKNSEAARFYARLGFKALNEERLAKVL